MTLVERIEEIGYAAARRIVGRLTLAGRVQELEAELRAEQAARRVVERAAKEVGALRQQLREAEQQAADRKVMANASIREVLDTRAQRDEAQRKLTEALRVEADLRKLHHEAEAENVALRRELEERSACQAEAIRVHEEELAAKLLLPERRSWPDLLAAVERTVHAKNNAEQQVSLYAQRAAIPTGDAMLLAQLKAAQQRAEAAEARLRAEQARGPRLPRVEDMEPT